MASRIDYLFLSLIADVAHNSQRLPVTGSQLAHCQATGHRQSLARYESCFFRAEVNHSGRYLNWSADPFHGNCARHRANDLVAIIASSDDSIEERRVGGAGTDHVGGYP